MAEVAEVTYRESEGGGGLRRTNSDLRASVVAEEQRRSRGDSGASAESRSRCASVSESAHEDDGDVDGADAAWATWTERPPRHFTDDLESSSWGRHGLRGERVIWLARETAARCGGAAKSPCCRCGEGHLASEGGGLDE